MLADIIPEAFFHDIGAEAWLWLLAVGAIVLMVVGADRAVSGAARLATALGMSTVLIGATVVSLGTTSPEAAVSVSAALRGDAGLALGNGVGSIICDTALVFGLGCLLVRLPLDRFVLRRHGVLYLAVGTMLTAVVIGQALVKTDATAARIPQWIGFVFVALLAIYMYLSVRWARQHPSMIPDEAKVAVSRRHTVRVALVSFAFVVVGLGLVVFGADVLIGSVKELATRYEVPQDVLAVTMVALGTSLPELATAIAAIVKGHPELLIGNVIGADILNVLFVIGVSAAATPAGLDVPETFVHLHVPVMMGALVLMGAYIFTGGRRFHRWQGVPLLCLYGGYYVALVLLFGVRH
ncbi:MAG: sodium:calcium antiporter [Phycisphaerae bacterium]|nr:sodium:calcium antiporter [Phycisphaerae bacterium]